MLTSGAASVIGRPLSAYCSSTALSAAPGGIGTGAILSLLIVGVVRLTAGAETPEPPLRLAVDWGSLVAGLAAYTLVGAALVGVITWAAFREPAPKTVEAAR